MAGTINLTKVGFSQMNENINLIVEENADLRRLSINEMVTSVNGVKPVNGNVTINIGSGNGNNSGSGSGIIVIDVTELPTENINEGAFYKLHAAKFISNYYIYAKDWKCHYVTELPEIGEAVTSDMINIVGYYNAQDKGCYGYVDSMVSAAAGNIPVGWYPFSTLAQAFNNRWGGVTTNPDDADNTAKVLLTEQIYIYQNGWYEIPFAHIKELDIKWEDVITGDNYVIDGSELGAEGMLLVKISDDIFNIKQIEGLTVILNNGSTETLKENETMMAAPGGIVSNYMIICSSSDIMAPAFGLTTDVITNGTYLVYMNDGTTEIYPNRIFGPLQSVKIDKKFLPGMDIDVSTLHSVASSGDYNDLINKPDLSSYVTQATVQDMLNNAMGNVIGGSY